MSLKSFTSPFLGWLSGRFSRTTEVVPVVKPVQEIEPDEVDKAIYIACIALDPSTVKQGDPQYYYIKDYEVVSLEDNIVPVVPGEIFNPELKSIKPIRDGNLRDSIRTKWSDTHGKRGSGQIDMIYFTTYSN